MRLFIEKADRVYEYEVVYVYPFIYVFTEKKKVNGTHEQWALVVGAKREEMDGWERAPMKNDDTGDGNSFNHCNTILDSQTEFFFLVLYRFKHTHSRINHTRTHTRSNFIYIHIYI